MESPETRQILRAQGLPAFVDTETTTMGWAVRPDGDSIARELGGSSSLQARPDQSPWEVLASSPMINNDYLKVGVNQFIGNVNLVGMGANLLSGGRVNFEIASLEYNNPMLGTTLELALMAVPVLGTRKIAAEGIEYVLKGRGANSAAIRLEAASNVWQARKILAETRPDLTITERNQIIKAFDLETFRVNTLTSPTIEFRFFDGVNAGLNGRWSTPQWLSTPTERVTTLALPNNQATRAATVTLQPGSTVFQGTVAPQLRYGPNLTGGGMQTYNAAGPRAVIKEVP
ncbi:hypothetical protein ED236_12250 [Pseudomethylobacillus aquaticus]|uniref:Uncharacterized protein n=1 Tax=Pseudomethylobacillus aquaticus TaxID=2676064 RepID=A0A3N0UU31_9PROT|nr:hypothetical protein [Pseudomethylobacillus aquaticus]ROH83778.1 hypothetical protein ED236_12250 [Pseudomethylobacillus aquaticus]